MRQVTLIATGVWITAGLLLAFALPPIVDKSSGLRLYTPQIAFFHVPAAVAMILAFVLSAWHGAMWLIRGRVEHDARSFAFAEVGAVLGVIATATGSIFAKSNWGAYWSWDPQQVGVLTTLLTYAALFALRGSVEDDTKRRNLWAVYAIFGCAVAIFGSAVYRRLLPEGVTLHPKNTLVTSDPLNKFALWFNVFGYGMLMWQVAGLRARLVTAQEKLAEMRFSWR